MLATAMFAMLSNGCAVGTQYCAVVGVFPSQPPRVEQTKPKVNIAVELPATEQIAGCFYAIDRSTLDRRRPLDRGPILLLPTEVVLFEATFKISPRDALTLCKIRLLKALSFSGDDVAVPKEALSLLSALDISAMFLFQCSCAQELLSAFAKNLRHVSVGGNALSPEAVLALGQAEGLSSLKMSHADWDVGLFEPLARLKSIKKLAMFNCRSGWKMGWIRDWPLTSIEVSQTNLEPGEYAQLASLCLESVAVEQANVSTLIWLREMPTLRQMRISRCPDLTLTEISTISEMRNLVCLTISNQESLRPADLLFIGSLTELENLALSGITFGPRAEIEATSNLLRYICLLPRLRRLDVSYSSGFSPRLVQVLVDNECRVEEVLGVGTAFGIVELEILSQLKHLKLIEIGDPQQSGDGPLSKREEESFRDAHPNIQLLVHR